MIPKVIHQVWIGGGPLTEEAERYHRTWHEHHPDWEIVLWTKDRVEKELFPLRNQAAYESETNHAFRADILRVELLHRFGGIYADMDMECLKPHDPLRILPAFLGRGRWTCHDIGEHFIETCLMGSVPGHPFVQRLVRHLSAWAAAFEGYSIPARTGPQWVQRELYAQWKAAPQDPAAAIALLPKDFFYPWWSDETKGLGVTERTLSAHHWWCSWRGGAWKSERIISLSLAEFRGRYFRFLDILPADEQLPFLAVLLETAAQDLRSPNVFYQLEGIACVQDCWGRGPQAHRLERRDVELGLLLAAESDNSFVRGAAREAMGRFPY